MTAVILIGIQASGKTTFYRERYFDTHVRLSLDMLKTRRREELLLEACITARQAFVVDNTRIRRASSPVSWSRVYDGGNAGTADFSLVHIWPTLAHISLGCG